MIRGSGLRVVGYGQTGEEDDDDERVDGGEDVHLGVGEFEVDVPARAPADVGRPPLHLKRVEDVQGA